MEILLIINPISGDKNKTQFIDSAQRLLKKSDVDYHLHKTTGKSDCEKVEELLDSNSPEKIIVAGGDGTLNMFLEPLMKHNIPVGFIPMGSSNGMAVELKLTDSPVKLLEKFLKSETTKKLDLLRVNDAHLLLHLGDIGANANLVENYDKDESRGIFTYAKHFWSEFKNLKSFEFEIITDQMEYERKGVMLAICNGRKYGTGIPLNSVGKMDDGLFELVVVKAVDFSDLITATLSKFDEDFKIENLETIQAKSAHIRLKDPKLLQIDGEVIDEFQYLNIELLPKALTFIC